jgi:hypothetical protein
MYRMGKRFRFEKFHFTGPGLMYNAFCRINPYFLNKKMPIGLINTYCGNMLILSWNGTNTYNYKIIDNNNREIFKHKHEGCIGKDNPEYWFNQLNKPWIAN